MSPDEVRKYCHKHNIPKSVAEVYIDEGIDPSKLTNEYTEDDLKKDIDALAKEFLDGIENEELPDEEEKFLSAWEEELKNAETDAEKNEINKKYSIQAAKRDGTLTDDGYLVFGDDRVQREIRKMLEV